MQIEMLLISWQFIQTMAIENSITGFLKIQTTQK